METIRYEGAPISKNLEQKVKKKNGKTMENNRTRDISNGDAD